MCVKTSPFPMHSRALTSAGAWRPLLVGQLLVQLVLAHLPDEHLEQAANHEQCIVGLPDKQLTVEEEERERRDRMMRNHTAVKHQNEHVQ